MAEVVTIKVKPRLRRLTTGHMAACFETGDRGLEATVTVTGIIHAPKDT